MQSGRVTKKHGANTQSAISAQNLSDTRTPLDHEEGEVPIGSCEIEEIVEQEATDTGRKIVRLLAETFNLQELRALRSRPHWKDLMGLHDQERWQRVKLEEIRQTQVDMFEHLSAESSASKARHKVVATGFNALGEELEKWHSASKTRDETLANATDALNGRFDASERRIDTSAERDEALEGRVGASDQRIRALEEKISASYQMVCLYGHFPQPYPPIQFYYIDYIGVATENDFEEESGRAGE